MGAFVQDRVKPTNNTHFVFLLVPPPQPELSNMYSSHNTTHSSTSAARVLNQRSKTTAEGQGAFLLLLEVTNVELLFSWKHGNC